MSSSPDDRARPGDERAADHQMVEALRRPDLDPASPEWRQLARALLEYAYPVLVAWGVTGTLRRQAATGGCRNAAGLPAPLRLDEDEARSLAAEVLTVVIQSFRSQSFTGWDPTGAASLRTCFVRSCLQTTADVYPRWHQRRCSDRGAGEPETAQADAPGPDPTESDLAQPETAQADAPGPDPTESDGAAPEDGAPGDGWLDDDPVVRTLVELQQAGYKLTEIAEVLRSADGSATISDLGSPTDRVPEAAEEPDG